MSILTEILELSDLVGIRISLSNPYHAPELQKLTRRHETNLQAKRIERQAATKFKPRVTNQKLMKL